MKKHLYIVFLLVTVLSIFSCENVEEGYRIDYPETPANFSVTLLTPDRGAVDEQIVFSIQAQSDYDIKSMVVTTSVSGGLGTGFTFDDTQVDPLIDHVFGTIQEGVKELDLNYTYRVANDSVDPSISFTLVDEYGSKTIKHNLYAVPPIVKYDSVVMFAQTNASADGFASSDGVVYHDLTNYSELTTVNVAIQESLDLVFLISNETAVLVAPYNGMFSSDMSIRNKTLLKLLPEVTSDEFDQLTIASLSSITEDADVKRGTTDLWDIKVGDIIGFRTDLASSNPYHFGMLRINAIHPANSEYYEGTSYMIEMDVVTQK